MSKFILVTFLSYSELILKIHLTWACREKQILVLEGKNSEDILKYTEHFFTSSSPPHLPKKKTAILGPCCFGLFFLGNHNSEKNILVEYTMWRNRSLLIPSQSNHMAT
jgi:hypothetical protein